MRLALGVNKSLVWGLGQLSIRIPAWSSVLTLTKRGWLVLQPVRMDRLTGTGVREFGTGSNGRFFPFEPIHGTLFL